MESKNNPLAGASVDLSLLLTKLHPNHETVWTITGEDGKARTLTVTAKPLQPDDPRPPVRSESLARQHDFFEEKGFADYLNRYATSNSLVVYADPSEETCWATLDEEAKKQRETLTFKPQLHPLWKPWADLAARGRVALSDFRDFLANNKRVVMSPPGPALAIMLSQLRGAREVTIHSGRGKDAMNGVLVKTSIAGIEQKESVPIPEEIVVNVPLYVGQPAQNVELDLVLDVGEDNEITVQIAAASVAVARVAAFERMLGTIRAAVAEKKAVVCYGKPDEATWDYLEHPTR